MNEGSLRELSGRCLCGEVSYVVTGEPIAAGHCYCRSCQRLGGAGHSSGALYPESSFAIAGAPSEYSFESAPGVVDSRLFCPTCGSNILSRSSAAPNLLTLMLGSLDDVNAITPELAIYVKQKADWDMLDEGIANLEGSAIGHVKLTR